MDELQLSELELASIAKHLLEWPDKARDLGLSEGDIDDIKHDHRTSKEQKRAVLRRWKEMNGDNATVGKLVRVARQNEWESKLLEHLLELANVNSVKTSPARHEVTTHDSSSSWKWHFIGLSVAVISILFAMNVRSIQMMLYWPFSSTFPVPRGNFVGRTEDVATLLEALDFNNKSSRDIICIVGPPGIGKSTLATYVGNEMIRKRVVVHYIDMAVLPEGQLKPVAKYKLSDHINFGIPLNSVFNYLSEHYWNNLLVLDNCDECINSQRESLQESVSSILQYSSNVKIMTTSRERTMYLEKYYVHELKPLSRDSACELLNLPITITESEKRMIANLTGEIPLALRIIGSLIDAQITSLTPGEIIDQLKRNPISFLSPLYLKTSMNISISLSYDNLDKKTQKVGKYLAFFPGSFDRDAAMSLLTNISVFGRGENFYRGSVNQLVARSLLEYDKSADRYNFHRLIKEFFSTFSTPLDGQKFKLAFQKLYGERLCFMTMSYIISMRRTRNSLDKELHNIQLLLDTILNPINHTTHDYANAVNCFVLATEKQYLIFHFSSEELIATMKKASVIFHRELSSTNMKVKKRVETIYGLFVRLTINLASFFEKDQALQQYRSGLAVIEKFASINDLNITRAYISFYSNLLFYRDSLNETMIKTFHERILSKRKELDSCFSTGSCSLYDIGLAYFRLEIYEESAFFFEKMHGNLNYSIPEQVDSLLKCAKCYAELNNATKSEEIKKHLVNMYLPMMNQTHSFVRANQIAYKDFYRFLRGTSEQNKSLGVLERLIESFSELDKATQFDITIVLSMVELAQFLYDDDEFTRAIKVASYGLDCIIQLKESLKICETKLDILLHMRFNRDQLQLYLVMSKSNFYLKNSSDVEVNKMFVETMDFILANNLTHTFEHGETCLYLIRLFNFNYLYLCFYPDYFFESIIVVSLMQAYKVLKAPLSYKKQDTKREDNNLQKEILQRQSSVSHRTLAIRHESLQLLPLSSSFFESIVTDLLTSWNNTVRAVENKLYDMSVPKYAVFLINVVVVFCKITFSYHTCILMYRYFRYYLLLFVLIFSCVMYYFQHCTTTRQSKLCEVLNFFGKTSF